MPFYEHGQQIGEGHTTKSARDLASQFLYSRFADRSLNAASLLGQMSRRVCAPRLYAWMTWSKTRLCASGKDIGSNIVNEVKKLGCVCAMFILLTDQLMSLVGKGGFWEV